MHGAVIAEPGGEPVPLAAAAHAEEDAVEYPPPVGSLTAGGLGRGVLQQDRLDAPPQGIGNFPNRVQLLFHRRGYAKAGKECP
jgi:hypothetical protein